MDELSEDDKLTVARARKIQRFLSQPFDVAKVFTGSDGKLMLQRYLPVLMVNKFHSMLLLTALRELLQENLIIYQNLHFIWLVV